MPLVALLLAACVQPTVYIPTIETPIETPIIEPVADPEPTEDKTPIEAPAEPIADEPQERITPMINAIPAYAAYIVDQCGTIWGIPANLQGCTQKERIVISTVDGAEIPSSELTVFTLAGYLYIRREVQGETGPILDYYRQLIGSDDVEIIDAMPEMPAESRIVLDCDDWLIETVVVNGHERTDIYNRHDIRGYTKTAKGCGPIIREMVTGYAMLDNGILWMSTSGAEFCPNNRLSADQIAEPGRLWR